MLCNHCGSQIDDDAMFCPVCGKAVTGGETARPAAGTAQPSGGAFQPAGTIAQPAAGTVQPPAAKKKSPLPLILGAAGIAAAAAAVFMLVVVPMQNRKKAFEVTDAFMKAVDAGDFDSAMQYFSEDMKDSRIEGFREINDGIQELIKPLDDAGLKDSYPAEYREICASAEEFKTTVFNNLLREYSLKESDIKADRTQASAPVSVKIISDISFDDYLDEEMIEQLSMTYMGANMDKVLAYAFSEDDAALEADMLKTMYHLSPSGPRRRSTSHQSSAGVGGVCGTGRRSTNTGASARPGNSTERYLCVNSDVDVVKIGKSVEYTITRREQNEEFCGNRF